MRLKSRKAGLEQSECFAMIGGTIWDVFSQTQQTIFRIPIPTNQNVLNSPLRCLDFSFSVQGLSNLDCLQEKLGKSWWQVPL